MLSGYSDHPFPLFRHALFDPTTAPHTPNPAPMQALVLGVAWLPRKAPHDGVVGVVLLLPSCDGAVTVVTMHTLNSVSLSTSVTATYTHSLFSLLNS